ncbi:POU domain, class 4, transcription factor 3-like [Tetranychus urticae]|uniref:POU domain protein n=1 Tax=Tetranychus urticae TaxID=32264 RepID=T1JUB8_TETUR|nr:POU domain, class 4, transcription factor 3-like [Tetranychus urticae]
MSHRECVLNCLFTMANPAGSIDWNGFNYQTASSTNANSNNTGNTNSSSNGSTGGNTVSRSSGATNGVSEGAGNSGNGTNGNGSCTGSASVGGGGGGGSGTNGSGSTSGSPGDYAGSPGGTSGPHGHGHHGHTGPGVNGLRELSSQCSYNNNESFLVNGMIPGFHHHHHHHHSAASPITAAAAAAAHSMQSPFHPNHHHHHPTVHTANHHHHNHHAFATSTPPHHTPSDPGLLDADPRELEAFAERFKQRRIKLGVTQADVGRALANLKLPGVGSLSQSTICRFESLTLSHNNMVALKPILQAWLEAAEAQARKVRGREGAHDCPSVLPSSDKKRKRTSIAAPEKRCLEAYFNTQPRPSGEKIAAIAEKLDLKKNVVRVWFCNQRQKQKRMKYSAVNGPGNMTG